MHLISPTLLHDIEEKEMINVIKAQKSKRTALFILRLPYEAVLFFVSIGIFTDIKEFSDSVTQNIRKKHILFR